MKLIEQPEDLFECAGALLECGDDTGCENTVVVDACHYIRLRDSLRKATNVAYGITLECEDR